MIVFLSDIKFFAPALLFVVSGCTSTGLEHRPVVSNTDLANYEMDLKTCREQAAKSDELDVSTEAGLLGAVTGALSGNGELGNTVVGAVVGAAGGALYTKKRQRDFIISCMQDKGYNVVAGD